MSSDLIPEAYNPNWGSAKIGKLWIGAQDLLENGRVPMVPDKDFYGSWKNDTESLEKMADRIFEYLKFTSPIKISIEFKDSGSDNSNEAGLFRISNAEGEILIDSEYKRNRHACAAILSHEITHLILSLREIGEKNAYENERLTDFATAYFGLGILILNGKHIKSKVTNISLITSILGFLGLIIGGVGFIRDPAERTLCRFGYWNEEEYKKIFCEHLQKNKLSVSFFSKFIKFQ